MKISSVEKREILTSIRGGTCAPAGLKLGDVENNAEVIIEKIGEACKSGIEILVFPELCITGYSMGDLFLNEFVQKRALDGLRKIKKATEELSGIAVVVGLPVFHDNQLFNTAAVIANGEVKAFIPKTHIPTYSEFYEGRHFASATQLNSYVYNFDGKEIPFTQNCILNIDNKVKAAVEICEDLWVPIPPSSYHAVNGAEIILNLSASNELSGKSEYRELLVKNQSARCLAAYLYSSAGSYESGADVIFGGHQMIAYNGAMSTAAHQFDNNKEIIFTDIDYGKLQYERRKMTSFMEANEKRRYTYVDIEIAPKITALHEYVNPLIVQNPFNAGPKRVEEIINIQCLALARRLKQIGSKNVVVGVSGGLDSTLATLIAAETFRREGWDMKGVHGITMPCFGTTGRTKGNAVSLMEMLNITLKEIDIKESVYSHFRDIGLPENDKSSLTFENSQARYRTMILMDYSSMVNGIVLGTGNLSELALGWCTYNGDHMSMYNINCSIPKTLVKELISYFRDKYGKEKGGDAIYNTIQSILDTKISPELLPVDENGENNQDTEKSIGNYEINDFFIYHTIRNGFSPAKIYFLARHAFGDKYGEDEIKMRLKEFYKRFFRNQFKRNCAPDGIKVGSVSLSPRGDWRMPSDAEFNMWIKEIDSL